MQPLQMFRNLFIKPEKSLMLCTDLRLISSLKEINQTDQFVPKNVFNSFVKVKLFTNNHIYILITFKYNIENS